MSIFNQSKSKVLMSTTAFALLAVFSHSAFGMDSEEEVVAIIGGGLSGLTAAYDLKKSGISATVYEGRNRLGGRTHTHYFNDNKTTFFEEGGTFIDDKHASTINLAKEVGVELTERGYGSREITVIQQGKAQNRKKLIEEIDEIKNELSNKNKILDLNKRNTYDLQNHEWRANPLLPHLSNLTPFGMSFIQSYYEDEVGTSISKASVYDLPWLVEKMEEYSKLLKVKDSIIPNMAIDQFAYDYTVKGGISNLVNNLANKLTPEVKVNLNYTLTHIQKEDKYILTFQSENETKKVKADRVIMTLPFSTLRYVNIDDSVGLNNYQKKAIKTLSYGTNSKIGIPVEAPKNISDDLLYYLNLDDKTFGWSGERALTLMVNAETGQNLTEEKATSISAAQCPFIQQQYSYIKGFGKPTMKNWSQDPFSRGSYSALTIDGDVTLGNPSEKEGLQAIRKFAEPVNDDRFIFAGEHTRADGTAAHIEGAIRSGYKAAELLKNSLKNKRD